jgi:Family of unknown function (DUF6090)
MKSNYLKYAIGEIMLVVIGILVALEVNNLNQSRKDKATEDIWLENLVEELKADTAWVNSFYINRYEAKVKGLSQVKSYYQKAIKISDTTEFLTGVQMGAMYGYAVWQISKSTYYSIVNSGGLEKIGNQKLREQIIEYYSVTDALVTASKGYITGYVTKINSLRSFNVNNPDGLTSFDEKYILEHIKTEEFYELVNSELTLAHRLNDFAKSTNKMAVELIKNIQTELD